MRHVPLAIVFWTLNATVFLVGLTVLYPSYGEICEKAADGAQQNCASYHIVFVGLWHLYKTLSDPVLLTAIATVAIAWFTLALRRSTDRLWNVSQAQLRHAEEVAKRQADEMQASLKIAKRSADIAKLAWLATDRPWIRVDARIIDNLTFGDEIST
jgi:hypothetical protein